jgi:hypothetical protein
VAELPSSCRKRDHSQLTYYALPVPAFTKVFCADYQLNFGSFQVAPVGLDLTFNPIITINLIKEGRAEKVRFHKK